MKLRYYQKECLPALLSYVKDYRGKHPIIALPTGTGKSLVIADFVKYFHKRGIKILILSHVKEILEQNRAEIENYSEIPVSINSASIGQREVGDVTIAGIQSVYKNPELFKEHKLVIVDEAHLINYKNDTMYHRFISALPNSIIVGLTATAFRLGHGYIYGSDSENLFHDLIVDWTSKDKFTKLIDDGYLCPLVTKETDLEMDVSGIRTVGGDFKKDDLADRFDREAVTDRAIQEIIAAGKNRKKWLIFAIDIKHAEHIAETLIRNGIPTAPVHSKMSDIGFDRDDTIEGFKSGKYRCVVNVNILTTGFNSPDIDLIAILRPTKSPVLHVQTLGRGCRIYPGKSDCLVLDFAGNTARLGPINDIRITKPKRGDKGNPITKTCPNCKSILPPAVRVCPDCGHKFKFLHGLSSTAGVLDLIEDGREHWIPVEDVSYKIHEKFISKLVNAPRSIEVSYHCSGKIFKEYVCVEHNGYAKYKADHWIRFRGGNACDNCEEFIEQTPKLLIPKDILVQKKGRYYSVKATRF